MLGRRALLPLLALAARAEPPLARGDGVVLWPCNASSPRQAWDVAAGAVALRGSPLLLTVANTTSNTSAWAGARVVVDAADAAAPGRQAWAFNASSAFLTSAASGLCFSTPNPQGNAKPAPIGTDAALGRCYEGNQFRFAHEAATGLFRLASNASLCLDAGSIARCDFAPFSARLYCDADAPADARLADLLPELGVDDYAQLLDYSSAGLPRLGLKAVPMGECLHGVNIGAACAAPAPPGADGFASTGCATSLPHALAAGASFNRSLWAAMGALVADEARALHLALRPTLPWGSGQVICWA